MGPCPHLVQGGAAAQGHVAPLRVRAGVLRRPGRLAASCRPGATYPTALPLSSRTWST